MFFKKNKNNMDEFDMDQEQVELDSQSEFDESMVEQTDKKEKTKLRQKPKKSRTAHRNILHSRMFIGVLCIIGSIIIVYGGSVVNYMFFNGQKQIYRAKEAIPRGTSITANMFDIVTVGSLGLTEGTLFVNDISPINMVADVNISKGDNFTKYNVVSKLTLVHPELESLVDDERAITITLNDAATTIGNRLQAGDVISIINTSPYSFEDRYSQRQKYFHNSMYGGNGWIASTEENTDQNTEEVSKTETPNKIENSENGTINKDETPLRETVYIARELLLQYVEVLYVDNLNSGTTAGADAKTNITIKVVPEQLEALAYIQNGGNGHAVFVTRNPERKAVLLSEQKNLIEKYIKNREESLNAAQTAQ